MRKHLDYEYLRQMFDFSLFWTVLDAHTVPGPNVMIKAVIGNPAPPLINSHRV